MIDPAEARRIVAAALQSGAIQFTNTGKATASELAGVKKRRLPRPEPKPEPIKPLSAAAAAEIKKVTKPVNLKDYKYS